MNALTTINNNSLANITEKEYSVMIEKSRNLRKSFKVGITNEDLKYVLAQNRALGRELNQVTVSYIVDADYLSKISDIDVLLNNMFILPDSFNLIFASRTPFIIFDVNERDANYLDTLHQKITTNLSFVDSNIAFAIKVYVNIPDMVRYQEVVRDILDTFPEIEIVSYIPLADQFDNTTMLEVPTAEEAKTLKSKLFADMQPIAGRFLLLTTTNSLGANTERNNYYKLRKSLGDVIFSEDSSEEIYARNLVTDYFFSSYLTITEKLFHIFNCPSLIQLGEFFYIPCYIQKIEVNAIVTPIDCEGEQKLLTITKDCVVESVDENKLIDYLKKDTRFINFSLVKINGEVYFVKKYDVKLFTSCLSPYGIGEMQYTMKKTLASAVRFITDMTDKELYESTRATYSDFRETLPHPLTREIVVREEEKVAEQGIWAERNSGLNLSHNLALIIPSVPLEELIRKGYLCPINGFLMSRVTCTWR